MNISDYTHLIGSFSGGDIEIENTPEKIADFICEAGQADDLVISTPDGGRILNTFGIYIDRCIDLGFLNELLKVLIPKQMQLESQAELPACPCVDGEEREPDTSI